MGKDFPSQKKIIVENLKRNVDTHPVSLFPPFFIPPLSDLRTSCVLGTVLGAGNTMMVHDRPNP